MYIASRIYDVLDNRLYFSIIRIKDSTRKRITRRSYKAKFIIKALLFRRIEYTKAININIAIVKSSSIKDNIGSRKAVI